MNLELAPRKMFVINPERKVPMIASFQRTLRTTLVAGAACAALAAYAQSSEPVRVGVSWPQPASASRGHIRIHFMRIFVMVSSWP